MPHEFSDNTAPIAAGLEQQAQPAVREFSNLEAIEMMHRCVNEIKTLRATIDRLRPKAEAYDNISAVLALIPYLNGASRGDVAGVDLAYTLERRIKELQPNTAPATPAAVSKQAS